MPVYHVTGVHFIHGKIGTSHARAAVLAFMQLHPEATPSYVGSRAIVGIDANTKTPILSGDDYRYSEATGTYTLVNAKDSDDEKDDPFGLSDPDKADQEAAVTRTQTRYIVGGEGPHAGSTLVVNGDLDAAKECINETSSGPA